MAPEVQPFRREGHEHTLGHLLKSEQDSRLRHARRCLGTRMQAPRLLLRVSQNRRALDGLGEQLAVFPRAQDVHRAAALEALRPVAQPHARPIHQPAHVMKSVGAPEHESHLFELA